MAEIETVSTAVRLPVDLHERLKSEADDRMVSRSLIVTRAIEEYLDQLPNIDNLLRPRD
jgi:predicted DNA-binding protein